MFTERTILLAVVIQVFVAGFSSFLVVGLNALVDPSSLPTETTFTVAVNESSDYADLLRTEGLTVLRAPTDEAAEAAFLNGAADAAFLTTRPLNDSVPVHVKLVLPDGDLKGALMLAKFKGILQDHERELREENAQRLTVEPLYVDVDVKGGSYGFVYALLIPLLVLLPVILSGALTADSITEEVQRKTLPLLLATPATAADVVEGKLLANVSLVPLLSAAWFVLLALNRLTVPIGGAVAIVVLATAMAFLMGLTASAFALLVRDRNTTQVLYTVTFFLILAAALLLPVSPVNAMAQLAAGSPSAGAYALVAGSVALAGVGWLALRLMLGRASPWMASGGR